MTARAYPCLSYADADAAIRWMQDVLSFREKEVHRDDTGAVAHAEMALGDALVMLGADRDDGGPGFSSPKGGRPTAGIYLGVEDADAAYARAASAGAEVIRELRDTTYGSREFGVRDPEGNLWFVGTYRP